jgi:hypothetical protein
MSKTALSAFSALVVGATLATVVVAAHAAGGLDHTGAPSTARGSSLLIKSQIDNYYCVEVAGGTASGRAIRLEQCGATDTQRWTFTKDSDGTNLIVDSQGMCLDGRLPRATHLPGMPVNSCRFTSDERYTFLPSGMIKNVSSGRCLSVPGAAANAAVTLNKCDQTKKGEFWKLAH